MSGSRLSAGTSIMQQPAAQDERRDALGGAAEGLQPSPPAPLPSEREGRRALR
jgi:hypothetical protein